jgi:hypothetical protein
VLSTHDDIKAWLEDIYARDMTHKVQHRVKDETGAAFTEACRYPDGTNVLCTTVIALADGQIADQTVVQVWDEAVGPGGSLVRRRARSACRRTRPAVQDCLTAEMSSASLTRSETSMFPLPSAWLNFMP